VWLKALHSNCIAFDIVLPSNIKEISFIKCTGMEFGNNLYISLVVPAIKNLVIS